MKGLTSEKSAIGMKIRKRQKKICCVLNEDPLSAMPFAVCTGKRRQRGNRKEKVLIEYVSARHFPHIT